MDYGGCQEVRLYIGNVILGNGQVASHKRMAVYKSESWRDGSYTVEPAMSRQVAAHRRFIYIIGNAILGNSQVAGSTVIPENTRDIR